MRATRSRRALRRCSFHPSLVSREPSWRTPSTPSIRIAAWPWIPRCARTGGEAGCAPNIRKPSGSIGAPPPATVGFAATRTIFWASSIAIRSRFWRCATASDGSRRLQRLIHLLGVPFRLYFVEDPFDLAVLANQERGAFNAHVLAPIHALFNPGSVSLRHFVIHIGQQSERQIELVLEFGLRGRFVGGHSDDHGVGLGEFLRVIAKLAGFLGAAGRVGLGIKIQHHVLTFETGERERLSLVVLNLNRRRGVAFLESFGHRNILAGLFGPRFGCRMRYNVVHEDGSVQLACLRGAEDGPGARSAASEDIACMRLGPCRRGVAQEQQCGQRRRSRAKASSRSCLEILWHYHGWRSTPV